MRDPILVTGAARSGTSMIAGCVHRCGAFGGRMSGPTRNNRKGMFENARIRNQLVKPFLRSLKVDPMGQRPLPDRNEVATLAPLMAMSWRGRVERVMREEGYTGGPWFYKGAKMTFTWPLWRLAFPDAFWIVVRRDPEGVVSSCVRTSFMRAYRTREGWREWLREHERCFEEMRADPGLRMVEVWSDDVADGRRAVLRDAIERAGLEWDENAVRELVAPGLFHRAEVTA